MAQREYSRHHRTADLDMVRMAHFLLCVVYHSFVKKKKKRINACVDKLGWSPGPGKSRPAHSAGGEPHQRAGLRTPALWTCFQGGNIAQDQNQQDSSIHSLISTYELRRDFQDGAGGSSKPGL